MHDFFDIVGLPRTAPPSEVRRVCARLVRRAHPDFQQGRSALRPPASVTLPDPAPRVRRDVAVDFVDLSAVLDRMQATFFRTHRAGLLPRTSDSGH